MRVVAYGLDNTNFVASSGFPGLSPISPLPLEDNYKELRRQIWLATDAAYKRALEDLSRKRAALQNRTRTEEIPDFTKAQPVTLRDEPPPAQVEPAAVEKMVRELSALFRQMPQVYSSTVSRSVNNVVPLQLHTHTTSFARATPEVTFRAV